MIDTSIHGVRSGSTDFCHHLAEILGIDSSEDGGEALLKLVENVCSCQLETRFIVLGESEHLEESFLFRRMAIEGAVVFLNLRFLFLGEPITYGYFTAKFEYAAEKNNSPWSFLKTPRRFTSNAEAFLGEMMHPIFGGRRQK